MKELIPKDKYGVFADIHDTARVDSLFVAKSFEKRHDQVVRDIEKLLNPNSGLSEDFTRPNFGEIFYRDSYGHRGMSISRYNSEGYYDPTAYEALLNIEREEKAANTCLPLVYIASPFAGNPERNAARARAYCRFAVSMGCVPLAPHLHYPQFLDDSQPEQRALGLKFALLLLGKCDELWVFGERISEGMAVEIEKAEKRGMPIRYFDSKCKEPNPPIKKRIDQTDTL